MAKHRKKTVTLEIQIDEDTNLRLQNLSAFCRADKIALAASLLHDILRDDEMENISAVASSIGNLTLH